MGERKINVAIEADDKNLVGVDLSHPENGNVGVGGSTYANVLLAYMLSTMCDNQYKVTIYHVNKDVKLPKKCFSETSDVENKLVEIAAENHEDIYICNMNRDESWHEAVAGLNIRIIIWSHCYIERFYEYRAMIHTEQIKRIICVSHEECDYFYDSDIHKKMGVIHPALPNGKEKWKIRSREDMREKRVTYIGSLVPQKGFGILASIWPYVVKRVPDAHLYVIGSGKLYNRNQKLGEFGIAEESFEKSFMHYLTDNDGKLNDSVTFCGLVDSSQKDLLMSETYVGVVNPSAKTENCCMCAVEFESQGVPVVSKGKHGMVEVILNKKSGLLSYSKKRLAKNIIHLLQNEELNVEYGNNAVTFAENFSPNRLVKEWEDLLNSVYHDKGIEEIGISGYLFNDRKWLRCFNRFFRRTLGIKCIPSIFEWDYYIKSIAHKIKRLLVNV